MRIGVLSDTHIPYAAPALPPRVLEIMGSVDAVMHAGDFQDMSVVETLQSLADFYGVCGNMDSADIRKLLPQKRVVHLGGFTIGIMHGGSSPAGLEDRIFAAFAGEKLDAIVYGHSHQAVNHVKNNILCFNPGSPTDIRFAPFCSIGILTLDETISGEIIKI